MEYTIPIKTDNYYREVLEVLSYSTPFSKVRARGKDVFAKLLEVNNRYKQLTDREKSKLLFSEDNYNDIGSSLGCSVAVVANVITELRNNKLIIKGDGEYYIINPKVLIPKLDKLIFEFK